MWVAYGLAAGFCVATADLFSKKALERIDPLVFTWLRIFVTFVFLAPLAVMFPAPGFSARFWQALVILVPLELAAALLYAHALAAGELGLTLPFLSFSPLLILLVGRLLLGEVPSLGGAAGVLLIVAGAYLLNADKLHAGLAEPFRAMWRARGSRFMLLVSVIFSVTSVLGKVCIQETGPYFFAGAFDGILSLCFLPALAARLRAGRARERSVFPWAAWPLVFWMGVFHAASTLAHFLAVREGQVSYVIALKRSSLLFAILYGWLALKERFAAGRLAAGALMVGGIWLIAGAG